MWEISESNDGQVFITIPSDKLTTIEVWADFPEPAAPDMLNALKELQVALLKPADTARARDIVSAALAKVGVK